MPSSEQNMMVKLLPRLEKWAGAKFGMEFVIYDHQVQMTRNRGRPDGLLVGRSPVLRGKLLTIAVEGKSVETQRQLLARVDRRQQLMHGLLWAILVGCPVAWLGDAVYALAAGPAAGLVAGLLSRDSALYSRAIDQAVKYPANVNLLAIPHILVISDWWQANGQEVLRLAQKRGVGVIVPTADSIVELTAPKLRPGNYLDHYCAAGDFRRDLV